MANYHAITRSNYFRVKDTKAFEEWCSERSLEHWADDKDGDTYHAISADTGDSGGWPNSTLQEIEDGVEDDVEIDFAAELADHLDPRDVAVIIEIGNEKLRYVSGFATAIRSNGETPPPQPAGNLRSGSRSVQRPFTANNRNPLLAPTKAHSHGHQSKPIQN